MNIDAMPGSMLAFSKHRPLDTNVETAISDRTETLTYFIFNEGALNTFDPILARERAQIPGYCLVEKVQLEAQPLSTILENTIPLGQRIDFMTIDVEGLDLQVLRSNDWSKFSPTLLLVEDTEVRNGLAGICNTSLSHFLSQRGYRPFATTGLTVFYEKMD